MVLSALEIGLASPLPPPVAHDAVASADGTTDEPEDKEEKQALQQDEDQAETKRIASNETPAAQEPVQPIANMSIHYKTVPGKDAEALTPAAVETPPDAPQTQAQQVTFPDKEDRRNPKSPKLSPRRPKPYLKQSNSQGHTTFRSAPLRIRRRLKNALKMRRKRSAPHLSRRIPNSSCK